MFEKFGKYINTAFMNSIDDELPFKFFAFITIMLFIIVLGALMLLKIFGAHLIWIILGIAFYYLWYSGAFIERE